MARPSEIVVSSSMTEGTTPGRARHLPHTEGIDYSVCAEHPPGTPIWLSPQNLATQLSPFLSGLSGGVNNTLTKWTGTNTIGLSSITDDGTTIGLTQNTLITAGRTLAAGANTLISGDKLQVAHLSVAGQAIGDIIYATSTTAWGRLGVGTNGQVLTLAGGVPTWANPSGSAGTLQAVYEASSSGAITLDATRGLFQIRDASAALGTDLFRVSNNAGSTHYFTASASSVSFGAHLKPLTDNSLDIGDIASLLRFRNIYYGTSLLGAPELATSGATLKNSPSNIFRARYWNGAQSTSYDAAILHVMDTTAPASHLSVTFATIEKLKITSDGLLGWISGNEQTTVGLSGAASPLPDAPTKYLKVKGSDGTTYVVPAYLAA